MYSFPILEPVHSSMSGSNFCFFPCIQISQESGKVVWCSHLFKSFPQFVVIHSIKGVGVVNKAEVDVFLECSCFFSDPVDVGNLISGCSAFSKSSLNIWKFSVHVLLKPCLESFEHYFASMWDECNCAVVLALPFFTIGMKTDLFQYWLVKKSIQSLMCSGAFGTFSLFCLLLCLLTRTPKPQPLGTGTELSLGNSFGEVWSTSFPALPSEGETMGSCPGKLCVPTWQDLGRSFTAVVQGQSC